MTLPVIALYAVGKWKGGIQGNDGVRMARGRG